MNKNYYPTAHPPVALAVAVTLDNNYQNNYNQTENINQIQDRLLKFNDFIMKHEISNELAIKLRQLEGFDIVVICDDSSSMNTVVTAPNTKNFMNLPSRWNEMENIIKIIMEASMLLDDDGIDIYFLNRQEQKNITNIDIIEELFKLKPIGYTPIVDTLEKILEEKRQILSEKKLLIILATDGEPTDRFGNIQDSRGNTEINKLFRLLNNKRNPKDKIFVTIVACTDDDTTMNYLNDWDNKLQNFDIVDDYYSEKERIINAQGKSFRFSFGDYIVKIMLGSIDKSIGSMDGSCINKNIKKSTNSNNNICTIL